MPTNASAGLISALKASLADSADGWTVTSVLDSAAQSSYVEEDDRFFVTENTRTIVLTASALTVNVAASAPMVLTYISVLNDTTYQFGRILANGAMFQTTDTALDTTLRAKAATFLAEQDTALTAALSASASTVDVIPANVLTAIKASLADTAAGWGVRNVIRQPYTLPGAVGGAVHALEVSMSLVSAAARIPAGTSLPAQLNYTARLTTAGDLVEARVLISGAIWRTKDAALHATMMALGAAFLTAQQAAIVAGLED